MIDDWLTDAEQRMDKSIEALHKELAGIRTGRATPALVDRLQVDYYGAPTPLQSLANITAPEARLLVIQPYDRGAMGAIEKAIQKSELGLNPSNDGTLIRIPIPQLTEERRKEFVKLVKHKGEEHKIAIRNERRDAKEMIEESVKEGDLTEDDGKKAMEKVQTEVDNGVKKVDEIIANKEKDLMQV